MNNQKAYELIRAWLSRPGASKCYNPFTGSPRYADGKDNHCAIGGPMAQVDALTEKMAKCFGNITILLPTFPEAASFWKGTSMSFLLEAQNAHDLANSGENFQTEAVEHLDKAAKKFGLVVAGF